MANVGDGRKVSHCDGLKTEPPVANDWVGDHSGGLALIRRLHLAEGESMRSIAARLGISRNTLAKAVSAEGPPTYVRAPLNSGIKAVEPAIRALLRENRRMPATVLAERVGWSGSPAWVPGERGQDPVGVCPSGSRGPDQLRTR